MVSTGAGVGATIVTVVVDFGLKLKHLHAEEISAAAYWVSRELAHNKVLCLSRGRA
jgi:hypothetical protein